MLKTKKHIILLLMFVIIILSYSTVNADSGPKPTLEITVINPQDSSYYLDLLGKEGEYGYFDATNGNEKYDNMHDQPIYIYNKDGWKAIHMRTWVLNGKLTGDPVDIDKNGKVLTMKHSFGYVGVPHKFKIIIQKSDGTIQVSDIIRNEHFNAHVKYDMKTNQVLSVSGNILKKGIKLDKEFFKDYLIRLLLTLIIEIFLAVPFFYHKAKRLLIIAGVNIVTQTFLTFGMIFNYPVLHKMPFNTGYLVVLLIGEVLVFLAEYTAYLRLFGKAEKRQIAAYTFIANVASISAGFIII
ncbi:hypothetical protein [Ruminiclostridium papyrosolvens]|uniref:Uncharacterized protein n=1 Tax=Ruminiclostridium papyrosolvens C7 TaxID=1330534 RepID=U4QY22_9FIRM|nr:hypothetical protein [Ruminiclostridium papyrosolvens]EPR09492.1 hypothetical protein L323_15690 [Ruminiclostridium papyrosolvens C7]